MMLETEKPSGTILLEDGSCQVLDVPIDKVLLECVKRNDYNLLVEAFNCGYHWYNPSFEEEDELNEVNIAVKNKNLDIVKFCYENGRNPSDCVYEYIFENDWVEGLKYLYGKVEYAFPHICEEAAGEGALECLKFLHQEGETCDFHTCENAAFCGSLDCLKYLHENGVEWDEKSIVESTKINNHLDCYNYLIQNGCPDDKSAYTHFYKLNNIAV